MWIYEKKLMYPVKIDRPNARLAKIVMEQYGGPDGELGASVRYLSQRFAMVTPEAKAILNDIGTEELAHLEMVGAMVQQLTRNLTDKEIEAGGYDAYYANHGLGVYPCSASGDAWNAMSIASKCDPIADLTEDMAAEQKARATYENILRLCDDPDATNVLRFLREREVVHFQRFGEALNIVQCYLDKNQHCCK